MKASRIAGDRSTIGRIATVRFMSANREPVVRENSRSIDDPPACRKNVARPGNASHLPVAHA
jgi:hypothetical protein